MIELGFEVGSLLYFSFSRVKLRVLALRVGRVEVLGIKRCYVLLIFVIRFEINRSLFSFGRGLGFREGEYILVEFWSE